MSLLPLLGSGILGWGIVVLTTPWLLKNGSLSRRRAQDLHNCSRVPIPRLGGLSVALAYVGVVTFIGFLSPEETAWGGSLVLTIAPLAMFGLGLWDDFKALGARKKLLAQVLIALVVSRFGIAIHSAGIPALEGLLGPELWKTALTVAWLVTSTNAMNLADGVDGLAGSLGLLHLALLICLGADAGLPVCQWLGMTGALVGFLWYNKPAARVYLGDGGAYFLGFQFGLASVVTSQAAKSNAPLLLAILALSVPILDMLLAVARRRLKGLPLFRPDRNHLHHKLLEAGMSPRRVVLWYIAITLSCVLVGILALFWLQGDRVRVALMVGLALGFSGWGLFRGWRVLRCKCAGSLAMRPEIAYALCMRTWLKHEAERCSSVEELFGDLKWAARRLGFTSVRLALADGFRVWTQPSVCGPLFSTCHPLQGGALGVLELKAPRCRLSPGKPSPGAEKPTACRPFCRPLLKDSGLIKVLSELLAEGWVEATRDWSTGRGTLRFDQKLPRGTARRFAAGEEQTRRESTPRAGPPGRDLLTGRAATFLRRTCGFALGAVFLSAAAARCAEITRPPALKQSLIGIPRVELPARAASLVRGVPPSQRPEAIGRVIAEMVKVSPTLLPVVVGAISKSVPEAAAQAAGAAAAQKPELAPAIATAAAAAAPSQTRAIMLAVCRTVPTEYREVALWVERVVPGSKKEIRDALASLALEISEKMATNRLRPPAGPSPVGRLNSNTGSISPQPALIRTGPPRGPGPPLIRGPRVGPPFIPLSGTLTNVTSSTSGTVPDGGRNYAKP